MIWISSFKFQWWLWFYPPSWIFQIPYLNSFGNLSRLNFSPSKKFTCSCRVAIFCDAIFDFELVQMFNLGRYIKIFVTKAILSRKTSYVPCSHFFFYFFSLKLGLTFHFFFFYYFQMWILFKVNVFPNIKPPLKPSYM